MAVTKFTEEAQKQRSEQLTSLRETRKDLVELAGLKHSPEWGKLTRLLSRYAEYSRREEKRVNADHDSGEIDAVTFSRLTTRARQKIADFEFISDLLERTQKQVETVEAEIARLEMAYKEAKEVLA